MKGRFPALPSIEFAILPGSLKIIWMMNTKTKVDHFQLWVLNILGFQMNNMARRVRKIGKHIESRASEGAHGQGDKQ